MPRHGTDVPLFACKRVVIVPIGDMKFPPLVDQTSRSELWGVRMRFMYVCYAAIGFAVARWFFKREAVQVADPVTQFRAKGLL